MQARTHQFANFHTLATTVLVGLLTVSPLYAGPISMDGMMMKLAVENNDASAQYFIGRNYLIGKSVHVNKAEAAKWFLKAAKQDHKKAQYELARLYLTGDGVEKNALTSYVRVSNGDTI